MPKRDPIHDAMERHRREGFGWRYDGFGDWSTEAIFAKLAELGILSDPETFRREALAAGEPRVISEAWAKRVQTGDFWQDFPLLVPDELWRRLLPDAPSVDLLLGELLGACQGLDRPGKNRPALCEKAADCALKLAELARTRRPQAPGDIVEEWSRQRSIQVKDLLLELPHQLQWGGFHEKAMAVARAWMGILERERLLGEIGVLLAKAEKRDEAVAQIAENERDMPASFEVRMASADAWEEMDDRERALRAYEEAERLAASENEKEWVLERKADCLEDMGRKVEAREVRKALPAPVADDVEPHDRSDDDEADLMPMPEPNAFEEAESMETASILLRLGGHGLPSTEEAAREAALAAGSPGEVATRWAKTLDDEDAKACVVATAFVLWERLFPELPHGEVLAARIVHLEDRIEEQGDRSAGTLDRAIEVCRRLLALKGGKGSRLLDELSRRAGWEIAEWMTFLPSRLVEAGRPGDAIALAREWRDTLDGCALDLHLMDALGRGERGEELERFLTEDRERLERAARPCLTAAGAWVELGDWEKALVWAQSASRVATEPWEREEAWANESALLRKLGRSDERRVLQRHRREVERATPADIEPPEPIVAERKVGRNEPCPCGSGRKYKKCCGVAGGPSR